MDRHEMAYTREKMNEANQAHATNYFAIFIALEEKGIITREEYERAKIKSTSLMEQEFAKKRDETRKENL